MPLNPEDWAKPIKWKAWYVIDNVVMTYEGQSEAEFRALPDDGFQAAVLAFPDATYRRISGCDYVWTDTGVEGRPIYGQSSPGQTYEEIVARYPNASVKRGKHTDDLTIQQIELAMNSFDPYEIETTATAF
jgi:hypothetical protein